MEKDKTVPDTPDQDFVITDKFGKKLNQLVDDCVSLTLRLWKDNTDEQTRASILRSNIYACVGKAMILTANEVDPSVVI